MAHVCYKANKEQNGTKAVFLVDSATPSPLSPSLRHTHPHTLISSHAHVGLGLAFMDLILNGIQLTREVVKLLGEEQGGGEARGRRKEKGRGEEERRGKGREGEGRGGKRRGGEGREGERRGEEGRGGKRRGEEGRGGGDNMRMET